MPAASEGHDDRGGDDEPVGVAWAKDQFEAKMIQGLLVNAGIPSFVQGVGIDGPRVGFGPLNPGDGQRVMVPASRAEEARALLADTLVEDLEDFPEPVNAAYLEDARGRRPRGYGLLGAYARIYLWSFGIFAVVFAVFLLLRGA